MYEMIKSIIISGDFKVTDITNKIDVLWVSGDLTDEQRTELHQMITSHLNPGTEAPEEAELYKLSLIHIYAITFPHAYGAPPFLTCIPLGNYYLAANPTNNVNLSQASFRVRAADGAAHNDRSILWLAIGY